MLRSLFLFALMFLSLPALAVDTEMHGYLRAGAGNDGKGGKKECFNNRGAPGNEFRLGNECSIYGETTFLAHVLKGENGQPFFDTQIRFAYSPPGNTSYESKDALGQPILNLVEAFVEAGNIDGSPLTYWAGKRFYRDVDLIIDDWFYFAAMSGNGGGVGNIPLGAGKLAVAYLMETGTTRTNLGVNAEQVADLRWMDVKLGDKDALNFWGAYGWAPGGTAVLNMPNNTQYDSQSGWAAGSRWRHTVREGFNDFTLLYGTRLLESFSLSDTPTLVKTALGPSKAFRTRAVESLSFQPSVNWGLHLGAVVESWDPRTEGIDSRGLWWNVGARPVYFFTDHWQLALEAGHSEIRIRSERDAGGGNVPVRTLTRFTLAPQLSLGPTLFARPVLRVYYTQSFWNAANKPFVGVDAPTFAGATSGQSVGVQTEVWF